MKSLQHTKRPGARIALPGNPRLHMNRCVRNNTLLTAWLLLLALLPALAGWAQPSITGAFWLEPGERSNLMPCDTMNVQQGPAGANITWDFSGLSPDSGIYAPHTRFYWEGMAVSSAPFSNEFPTADLGYLQFDSTYSFVQNNNDTLEWVGTVNINTRDSVTTKVIYSNPEKWVTVPFTYGDSSMDQFAGTATAITSFGTFSASVSGSVSWQIDGYGTLILPNATYNNVARIRLNRTMSSTATVGGATTTVTNENYLWFSAAHEYIILDIENIWTNNPPPVPNTFGRRVFYAKNPPAASGSLPVSVESVEASASMAVKVVPNPAVSRATVSFTLEHPARIKLHLLDQLGREVAQPMERGFSAGRHSLPLKVSHLPAGHYLVRLQSATGVVNQKLLITGTGRAF